MATRIVQGFMTKAGTVGAGNFLYSQGPHGQVAANENYASATDFYIQAPPNTLFVVTRLIVYIEDTLTGGFSPAQYGGQAALTNGITVQHRRSDDSIINDLTDEESIRTNGQWMRHAFNALLLDNNQVMSMAVDWDFDSMVPNGYADPGESGVVLLGEDKLVVCLEDDFSGLDVHTFQTQGVLLNGPSVHANTRIV